MQSTVTRWGTSLAVRIPAAVVRRLRLQAGASLSVAVAADGAILLRPLPARPSLDERIALVTAQARQPLRAWGPARGAAVD